MAKKAPTEADLTKLLIDAAYVGNLEEIVRLLSSGVSIDAADCYGNTALIWACRLGRVEIIEYLINSGANVNAEGNNQWTALHWTCNNSHIQLTEKLLNNGADFNALNSTGKRPFDCVKTEEDKERFRVLADSLNFVLK